MPKTKILNKQEIEEKMEEIKGIDNSEDNNSPELTTSKALWIIIVVLISIAVGGGAYLYKKSILVDNDTSNDRKISKDINNTVLHDIKADTDKNSAASSDNNHSKERGVAQKRSNSTRASSKKPTAYSDSEEDDEPLSNSNSTQSKSTKKPTAYSNSEEEKVDNKKTTKSVSSKKFTHKRVITPEEILQKNREEIEKLEDTYKKIKKNSNEFDKRYSGDR